MKYQSAVDLLHSKNKIFCGKLFIFFSDLSYYSLNIIKFCMISTDPKYEGPFQFIIDYILWVKITLCYSIENMSVSFK